MSKQRLPGKVVYIQLYTDLNLVFNFKPLKI